MASETLRGLNQPLLLQKFREYGEPHLGIVDLEHALLDRQRQRQQLRQTVTDPRSIVERDIDGKILSADALDQELEEARERLVRGREYECGFGSDVGHLSDHEAV